MKNFWKYITNIGVHEGLSFDRRRNVILINKIGVIISMIVGSYIPLTHFIGDQNVTFYVVIFFFLFPPIYLLNKLGHYRLSKNYLYLITVGGITALCILSGKDVSNTAFYIASGLLPLLLYKSRKYIILLFILNTILFFVLEQYIATHDPVLHIAPEILKRFYYLNYLATFFVVFLILHNLKKTNDEFEDEIRTQSNLLQEKNREITASIQYAKRLQDGMLVSEESIKQYLPQSFILFQPKDIVSGDFYWIEKYNDNVLFAAVDCTGHGVPGAMVSLVGYNGLNRCTRIHGLTEPGKILDELSDIVEESFGKSQEDVKDGMDMGLCSINYESKELHYAGANNPLYHIRNGELTEIKADKQAVGKVEFRKDFTDHTIDLQKEDVIYVFSDGFADQFGGPKGKKYTYKRFRELLCSIHSLPMEEQKEKLSQELENWKGDLDQIDDVCVFGVKI